MTYGLYAGISAADLGHEPDEPVATCSACDGPVYRRNNPPHGLICSECGEVYTDTDDIATAAAYDLEQWEEMQSGYCDTVAEGLERWTR